MEVIKNIKIQVNTRTRTIATSLLVFFLHPRAGEG